jgi:hypothetical protein
MTIGNNEVAQDPGKGSSTMAAMTIRDDFHWKQQLINLETQNEDVAMVKSNRKYCSDAAWCG